MCPGVTALGARMLFEPEVPAFSGGGDRPRVLKRSGLLPLTLIPPIGMLLCVPAGLRARPAGLDALAGAGIPIGDAFR